MLTICLFFLVFIISKNYRQKSMLIKYYTNKEKIKSSKNFATMVEVQKRILKLKCYFINFNQLDQKILLTHTLEINNFLRTALRLYHYC